MAQQSDSGAEPGTATIAEAEARLQELEQDAGRFDTGLIEPLRSLAEMQLGAGRLNAAETLLNRQLDIQRINLGLHSATQIPVLENLIRLYVARGEWEEARDTVSHLVWIHSRSDDINAGEQLAGLQRARAWLMLLLQRDSSDQEARHLLMYRDVSERMEQLSSELFDEKDPRRLPYLYESSKADLALALTIMQNPLTGQEIIEYVEGIRGRPMRQTYTITSVADLEQIYGARASSVSDRSFRKHMSRHASTIDDMLDIARETEDREAVAMLTMYRGDSTLLRQQYERRSGRMAGPQRGRGSLGTAVTYYRDAFDQLRALGYDDEMLMGHFGCPSLLPLNSLHLRLDEYPECSFSEEGDPQLEPGSALLGSKLPGFSHEPLSLPGNGTLDHTSGIFSLNISTNGQVSGNKVIEAFPDEKAHRSELRRFMENLQFRPALEPDGSATRTTSLHMVVRFISGN
ncbi:MAG: tetratricopeptide repeat protein [Pseudohongiellaceae bacterium]